MNKKVVVIVVLGAMQSAHAFLFEALLNLPGIKKICSIFVAKNSSRKSIMPATTLADGVIQKRLLEEELSAQTTYGLKIINEMAGNVIIRTHSSRKVIIEPTAYASLEQALEKITYAYETKDGLLIITSYNHNIPVKQKASLLSSLASLVWRKNKTETPGIQNKLGLHLIITVPKEYEITTKTKEHVTINNLKGPINIETNVGNVNVHEWELPNGTATQSTIKIDMGNVHVSVPNNTVVSCTGTNPITNQGQQYKKGSLTKGAKGLHTLTISTIGKIDLDPISNAH